MGQAMVVVVDVGEVDEALTIRVDAAFSLKRPRHV
jgi:hypothetical protein